MVTLLYLLTHISTVRKDIPTKALFDCYNFVSHEDFIPLEEAQSKGLDVLPKAIAEKAESERTDTETKLARGLEEMKARGDSERILKLQLNYCRVGGRVSEWE